MKKRVLYLAMALMTVTPAVFGASTGPMAGNQFEAGDRECNVRVARDVSAVAGGNTGGTNAGGSQSADSAR